MTYNKSEIMKKAWSLFRQSQKWADAYKLTFSAALKRAWNNAKEAAMSAKKDAEEGRVTMSYSQYKNNYAGCATLEGSYNKRDKSIVVLTKVNKYSKAKASSCGICPKCGTYCYGDCQSA